MEYFTFKNQDDAYQYLVACRIERELAEEDMRAIRARSKAYVIQAITEQGLSVAKAADLSGHNRQSITLWLQIHNAEKKGRDSRK